MDKVYFLKDFEKMGEKTKELLDGLFAGEVIVKLHFGEPGNKNAFTPEDVKPVIDALKGLGLEPVMTDTTVRYSSPRDNVKDYTALVEKKGYTKLGRCLISDTGKPVKVKDFTAQVSKELVEAENVLVLSHVKGHACSGFGGAIKNLGMGGVTAETKGVEHTLCQPKFVGECTGCGTCVELCPGKAIELKKGKAVFNLNACWGCSICEIECPVQCLAPEKAFFDDLLAQGAAACINTFSGKAYYINVIKNISKRCDCASSTGGDIAKDVGVLFSENPVAIDKASVDLVNKSEGRDVFREENHKDPLLQVKYASEHTGKSMDYELVEI